MTRLALSNLVGADGLNRSWLDLVEETKARLGSVAGLSDRRLMFLVENEIEAVSLVAAGVEAGLDFAVVEKTRVTDELKARLQEQGVQLMDGGTLVLEPEVPAQVVPGRISVLTSGTTGLPKLIPHTAESLNTFDRVRHLDRNTWFLPYQVGSYAWYQMVFLGLFVEGQDLVLAKASDLMASFEAALRDKRITSISSTPTFWRQAAMSIDPEALAGCPLRSISLGGEIVDQAILDYLKGHYPTAVIKHIYASSETGAAIVVSDGKAGFDAALLDPARTGQIAVRVVEGKLQIRSRYGNTGSGGGWIETGDLVEEIDGRVYFRGRADNQMINVGGQKAYPAAIESELLSHPHVVWAQVVARRAPLMGYLPMANLVLHQGVDPDKAEQELTMYCEARMPEYAVPRIWNFLDAVPLRASLKS